MSNTATMYIAVAPPPIVSTAVFNSTNGFTLTWNGGVAPFQVQMSTNLDGTNWVDVGDPITSNSFSAFPSNPAVFYRIMGQ
jgi:hypothetical protein